MENLPTKVIQEMDRLRSIPDSAGHLPSEAMLPLLAALSCHGFTIKMSYGGNLELKKAPWIEIESLEAPALLKQMQDGAHSGPEFTHNRQQLWQANQKEGQRLQALLNKFYESHRAGYPTMLIIETRGPGYARLAPNASSFAKSDTNFAEWLKLVQEEIKAFASFVAHLS